MSGRASELARGLEGFNSSPHLPLTDKYFRHNKAATTMVRVVAVMFSREEKGRGFKPNTSTDQGGVNQSYNMYGVL